MSAAHDQLARPLAAIAASHLIGDLDRLDAEPAEHLARAGRVVDRQDELPADARELVGYAVRLGSSGNGRSVSAKVNRRGLSPSRVLAARDAIDMISSR